MYTVHRTYEYTVLCLYAVLQWGSIDTSVKVLCTTSKYWMHCILHLRTTYFNIILILHGARTRGVWSCRLSPSSSSPPPSLHVII